MVEIPAAELQFAFSRSGGPGGQNVNRRETRVQLRFDVRTSSALSDEQKAKILAHPAVRHLLDDAGAMQIAVDTHRSQRANMDTAIERLNALLAKCLAPRKKRVPTKASKASKRRRLADKKRRSTAKSQRQINRRGPSDD